ncbi:WDR45 [Bugula neritina]|uniref:WDR45 n=1 Tax=Bugula neritina TaxID=10212 RepID=A0A7J7J7E6_BUGNE|nr:WDR45 [Bugula neritina]
MVVCSRVGIRLRRTEDGISRSRKVGSVQIVDFGHSEHTQVSPNIIPAHKHEVTCIALNSDGSKVATASEHGTIIRLFNTTTKEKLLELRRGQDPARVFSISFSPDSSALCVTSDKGTVHIFAILKSSLNQRSALPNVGGIVSSHTDAQWSPVKFTVPAELACVCTFLKNKRSTVVALCVDGSYHMYRFSLDPASCKAEAYEKFLELGDSMEM